MKRIYLNDGWQFTRQYTDALKEKDCALELESVRLPHTCAEVPLHYFDESIYQMVSGYRRILPAMEEWRGKCVLLTFEGVGHDSRLYVNGTPAAAHHCGYTAFTVDISGLLEYGKDNVIALRVDSREALDVPPFGFVIDYMTYGGIYRDVYLEVREQRYLADVFLKGKDVLTGTPRLESEISIHGPWEGLTVRQSLSLEDGIRTLGEAPVSGEHMELSWPVGHLDLWDIDHPVLYEVVTELLAGETVLDRTQQRFGFRQAEFRADGFYLNGRKLKLRGLNRHQSYPYVGYAMPASMQRLDADILKRELGLNAVRTSHYPQSHDFLDRCDELGLLVFTEFPGWQHIGGEAWKDQAVQNVRDMVLQYRNHTSILLWGVRINESVDDDEFYRRTNAEARRLDPTRPTGGVRCHKRSSLLEDVYTYNDFVHEGDNRGCEKKRAVTSRMDHPYLISEYGGHMYPTKAFDCEEHRLSHAIRHANVLDAVAAQGDIAGSFGWCMFDYNTHKDFGSGDRICYHGVMDMFRNPKLAAWVYAAQQEQSPVLELSSAMDIGEHPGCYRGETYIFTNAPRVRMYKNGTLVKEFTASDTPYRAMSHGPIPLDDFIGGALHDAGFSGRQERLLKSVLNAYAKFGLNHLPRRQKLQGLWLMLRYRMSMRRLLELYNNCVGNWGGASTAYRFDALDNEGNVVRSVTKEPVRSLHLSVRCDHTALTETRSYDVAAVRICAVDGNGNLLSYMNDPVTFSVTGPIALIGPETAALQGGMGGTYVKTTGASGPASLTIRTAQAEPVTVRFTAAVREEA